MARSPCDSQNRAVHARSRRDAGTGTVSSAQWQWHTLMGALRGKPAVFSSCTPASWPSQRPRLLPPPKPKRPSASPGSSSAWQPAGVPVRPPPQRPAPTRKAGGRDGGAARRAAGALMRSTSGWTRSAPPKSGRVEAGRRRRRPPRSRFALASSCTPRPWSLPRTRTGGPSSPPLEGQRWARMPRCSRRIRRKQITVDPGLRWIKHPAALSPVWLEKPARIAA